MMLSVSKYVPCSQKCRKHAFQEPQGFLPEVVIYLSGEAFQDWPSKGKQTFVEGSIVEESTHAQTCQDFYYCYTGQFQGRQLRPTDEVCVNTHIIIGVTIMLAVSLLAKSGTQA